METDDLSIYLRGLAPEDPWRVDAVLKAGSLETTQRVFFVGRDGSELGPFVRKRLSAGAGLGSAYETVYEAQRRGARLPHLPRIVRCDRSGDELTVVMEFVSGETLEEAVGRARTAGERLELVRARFGDLCDAVIELHERLAPPVIHRDLKPGNVMVSEGGVTLIDLGIARVFKEGSERDTTHFGTRAYAPPEQFGFGQTDVRSDVYALGMLLFFCLTGSEPTADLRERGFAGAGLPERLRQVVVGATQLDPALRPASVRELRAAALAALEDPQGWLLPAPVPPVGDAPSVPGRLSRVPGWLGVVWNLLLVPCAALLLASCVESFRNPTPVMASYPMWYQALGSLVLFPLIMLCWLYLMADRRPLRRRVPALARLTVGQEVRWGIVATVALLAVWFAATLAAA